jgi:hypothetical protein
MVRLAAAPLAAEAAQVIPMPKLRMARALRQTAGV